MARLTPELARSRARLGALAVAAKYDPRVTTAPARRAFEERLLERLGKEVDAAHPGLEPVERARRIEYARRLYFARLAFRSQVARAANARSRRLTKRPWLAASDAHVGQTPVTPTPDVDVDTSETDLIP